MKDVVAMGKLVDDHIQQHMRKLRKQQIAEMEKVRSQTCRDFASCSSAGMIVTVNVC